VPRDFGKALEEIHAKTQWKEDAKRGFAKNGFRGQSNLDFGALCAPSETCQLCIRMEKAMRSLFASSFHCVFA
jgi:hypothetical protein